MPTEIEELRAHVARLQEELEALKQRIAGDLVCRSITVQGESGSPLVSITALEEQGLVQVHGGDGGPRATLGATPEGGCVTVWGTDGELRAAVGVDADGGA